MPKLRALRRPAIGWAIASALTAPTVGCELLAGIETNRGLAISAPGGAGGEGGSGGAGGAGGSADACLVGSACAVQVAGAEKHACVLLDDATVWCWGSQTEGQLARGLGAPSGPVPIGGLPPIARIVTARLATCALAHDGSVWCWGSNTTGECGLLGPDRVDVPTQLSLPPVANVFSGPNTICATTAGGLAHCWGRRHDGKDWNDMPWTLYPSPTEVPLPSPVDAIGITSTFACAARDDEMACWGHGLLGGLANDSTDDSALPVAAMWPSGPVAQIEGSGDGSCALDDDGQVYCWSSNSTGQAGFPAGQPSGQPAPKVDAHFYTPQNATANFPASATIIALSGGWRHVCALTEAGTVICWGLNGKGQLGHGAGQPALVPGIDDATALDVGQEFSCVVRAGGAEVACWGSNQFGQIDPGSAASSFSAPVPVAFP